MEHARSLVASLFDACLGTPPPRPAPTLELPPLDLLAGSHEPVDLPELSTSSPAALVIEEARPAASSLKPSPLPINVADAARARLIASGHWRPTWDADGLGEVFAQLGDGPALDRLVNALSRSSAVVPLGAAPCAPMGFGDEGALVNGTPSTASLDRHRRALALVATSPGLPYAEALRRVAP